MKKILRTLLFVGLALYLTQYLMKAFDYGIQTQKTMLLVVLALSLLYIIIKPLISIISLPTKGVTFFFLSFVTTAIIFYVLTIFLPGFSIKPTTLPGLTIFGYVLPSKSLDALWAMVFSALMESTVYLFLEGLCSKK